MNSRKLQHPELYKKTGHGSKNLDVRAREREREREEKRREEKRMQGASRQASELLCNPSKGKSMASSKHQSPRRVIEEIRANKFGIGSSKKNPLALDMHQAITHLAAELYQKDLHFVMELVQNADDNTYAEGVVPELQFVLAEADLAGVGVEWTLFILNNEVGFSAANVESLCSIGLSTKKGKRDCGYIGEKGIGFKSVFLITKHPIVISNGFRIRFNDAPTKETDLGYIVPEWAEQPSDADLLDCLGGNELPNTVIVLPIRPDKVQAMHEQLFQLSPQLVLFLRKIEKLSVRQLFFSRTSKNLRDPTPSKNICVQKHTSPSSPSCVSMIPNTCTHSVVRLSSANKEAVYHVWQQEFPVSTDHEVDHRRDVHSWMITLAFPLHKERKHEAGPDLYAFLPTKVTAGFPFLINADFLLVSSRESIRFESRWNKGILSCIPEAFIAAFMFLLKAIIHFSPGSFAHTPLSSIYKFVPCSTLAIKEVSFVRDVIIQQMKNYETVLCDGNLGQHFPNRKLGFTQSNAESCAPFFCLPKQARIINSEFGHILQLANKAKISPPNPLMSQMTYIVDAEMVESYQIVLSALKVSSLEEQEYVEIIRSPNWLESLTEDMYVEVLYFLSWYIRTPKSIYGLPLVKYVDEKSMIKLLAPTGSKGASHVYMSELSKDEHIVQLWRSIFQRWVKVHFMPTITVQAISNVSDEKAHAVCRWLKEIAGIQPLSVESYGESLIQACKKVPLEKDLILATMHFFVHATDDGYLPLDGCKRNLSEIPLIDNSQSVLLDFKGPVLLPGSVCNWPRILVHNTWKGLILCLSESYLNVPSCMPPTIQAEEVVQFLKKAVRARDIFDIQSPPDAPMVVSALCALSAEDVRLLLNWIKSLSYVPCKLKASLRDSAWIRTMDHGIKPPSMSILDLGQWSGKFKQEDVPFVDTGFYGDLRPYISVLNNLGMVTKVEDGVNAVAEHVRGIARAGNHDVRNDTAIKWYTFLRLHNWMGWSTGTTEKLIWVPGRPFQRAFSSALGSWKCADECVISDPGSLFQERVVVLDRYYTDEIVLAFFQQNMKVAASPGTEKYCQLWVDWGESGKEVCKDTCENAWCIISKGWEFCARVAAQNFKRRCRIPCFAANEGAEKLVLARPEEVLYADNHVMAEVFSSQKVKFVWYPRNAAAVAWVEELIKCYTDLGVKKLSDALDRGKPVSYRKKVSHCQFSSSTSTRTWQAGIYRAILGFLANPKYGLSAQARKRMVMQLENVELLHVEEVGEVKYRVSVAGMVYEASRATCVRWEKGEKRIYVLRSGRCNKLKMANELAEEVAKGVVGAERLALVEGLQEMLLLASGFEFEDKAVQELLSLRNLGLTLEDEALLNSLYQAPSHFGNFSGLF